MADNSYPYWYRSDIYTDINSNISIHIIVPITILIPVIFTNDKPGFGIKIRIGVGISIGTISLLELIVILIPDKDSYLYRYWYQYQYRYHTILILILVLVPYQNGYMETVEHYQQRRIMLTNLFFSWRLRSIKKKTIPLAINIIIKLGGSLFWYTL